MNKNYEDLISEVKNFSEKYFSDDKLRRAIKNSGVGDDIVKAFAGLDFHGHGIVDKVDGKFDIFAQVLVLEEIARITGATLPFTNDLLNLQIVSLFGSKEKKDFVNKAYKESGRIAFALAISEPGAGSDTMSMQTEVKTIDGCKVLNGVKTFVNNGEYCPYLLVAAIDRDVKEIKKYPNLNFWLIPYDEPGIKTIPIEKIGQSILPFCTVTFENVEIKEEYKFSDKDVRWQDLFHIFEIGRLFSCATALGLSKAAMLDAVTHALERSAFGETISNFQQIQEMLTEMELKIENMQNLVYKCAREIDLGKANRLRNALMKRYVPKTATEVASDAMQIFGGRGYTISERVSRIWQDCRGFQIAEGTDQIMVYIAAPLILEKYHSISNEEVS